MAYIGTTYVSFFDQLFSDKNVIRVLNILTLVTQRLSFLLSHLEEKWETLGKLDP